MEYYENNQEQVREKYLKDLNAHLPDWIKQFVSLYTSDLKYKIKKNLNKSKP